MSIAHQTMVMTERQRKFRESYKSDISPFYSGLLHITVMYSAGAGLIYYCLTQVQGATWSWLTIIPVAIAGNFVEWAMHKYVMHRQIDVFALRAIYDRHTRQHHQYFTDTEYTIDTTREFRIVFFPWRVLTVLIVSGSALGYAASVLLNPNVGYILFITMIAHYLVYETFHFCCHVHENWFVRNMPFINTIRRHHAAHHNLGIMMHKNMNLTFPLADWIMGTTDLKRGLFGTLFNGFDQSHIDPKIKVIADKFKNARVQEEFVTLEGPILNKDESLALKS